jgi:LmbE family N-acetylglucosaminyl deacetylase
MAAHADDCPFGIAGILLKAVAQDYRVVILNFLTRGAEVAAEIDAVNAMFGVETITLEY